MADSKISSGEYIFNKLKDKIRSGKYQAGDKLPTEMELAEKYSVSRNTVRGATVSYTHLDVYKRQPVPTAE